MRDRPRLQRLMRSICGQVTATQFTMRDRLTAGHENLDLVIGVRISIPQPNMTKKENEFREVLKISGGEIFVEGKKLDATEHDEFIRELNESIRAQQTEERARIEQAIKTGFFPLDKQPFSIEEYAKAVYKNRWYGVEGKSEEIPQDELEKEIDRYTNTLWGEGLILEAQGIYYIVEPTLRTMGNLVAWFDFNDD